MLKLVTKLDYRVDDSAPQRVPAVINLESVSRLVLTGNSGPGPSVLVTFRDGSTMTCLGHPEDFVTT